VKSTPTFVIGNQVFEGLLSYDQLKILVDSAAARASRATPPADSAVPPDAR
jgi:hypothetical protein